MNINELKMFAKLLGEIKITDEHKHQIYEIWRKYEIGQLISSEMPLSDYGYSDSDSSKILTDEYEIRFDIFTNSFDLYHSSDYYDKTEIFIEKLNFGFAGITNSYNDFVGLHPYNIFDEYEDKINEYISDFCEITDYEEDYEKKYIDKNGNIDWTKISQINSLPKYFIEKYKNKVDWEEISYKQKLSENFIEKYKDKIYWIEISWAQKLSESFIEKYKDKVDWKEISWRQKLSENFIEKYSDKIDWKKISQYQNLSEKFIEKHVDKVNWEKIFEHQKISEEFAKKYADKDPKEDSK